MRVLGVLDLLAGRAVHARGGRRDSYEPVQTVGGVAIEGNAVALARTYQRHLGLTELYAADLDAIANRPPQDTLVAALAALGAPFWLDAGAASVTAARHAHTLRSSRGGTRPVCRLPP